MLEFTSDILDAVRKLREMYSSKIRLDNLVLSNFPVLEIIKETQDRSISTKFFYNYKEETFEMQAPDVQYHSRISHYDFAKPERRWVRNKSFIFSLIRDLKKCGLWAFVSNKEFIVINTFNDKTSSSKLLAALDKLTKDD